MIRSQLLTVNPFLPLDSEGSQSDLCIRKQKLVSVLRTVKKTPCILYGLLVLFLPVLAKAQANGGAISRNQCIVTGATPANFTSIRDVSGTYLNFYWERATAADFSAATIVATNLQEFQDGALVGAAGTVYYYRRRVDLVGGGQTFSNTIKVTIVAATANPTFTVNFPATDLNVCQGSNTLIVNYTTTADEYMIVWSTTAVNNGFADQSGTLTPGGANNLSVNIPPAALPNSYTGTLIATVSATGCALDNAAPFTVKPLPTATVTGSSTVCLNAVNPSITFTGSDATAPYTFTYKINGGSNQTVTTTSGNATTVAVPTSGAGSFAYTLVSVQESSSKACTNSASGNATVVVNSLPTATITPGGFTAICAGESITLTAGGGISYLWSTGETTASIFVSNSNVITVTATDVNGCKGTSSAKIVTVNALPSITGALSLCVGATTTLTGSGTANATSPWVSSNTAIATVNSSGLVTGITSGTVTVTYKNDQGCQQTASVTVNALPVIGNVSAVCAGSTITLTGTATPDATTPWSSSNTTIATVSTTGVVTGVSSGSAIVTYKNNNGCQQTASIAVNALPAIGSVSAVCVGSAITLTGSGVPDATTPWSSSSVTIATISNAGIVSGVAAGSATITYLDNNGCQQTALITVNPKPVITGVSNLCAGAATTLTGSGTVAAVTPWTSSNTVIATVSSSGLVTGLVAGLSTITYSDNNGCQQTVSMTVNALPVITGVLDVCAGSTTLLTGSATPHASTPWSSSNATIASITNAGVVSGVSAGSVTITYLNNNGCQQTAAFTVNAKPLLSGISNVCAGASTNLTGSGMAATVTPWTSSNNAIATVSATGLVTGLVAGPATITYTDDKGCQQTASVVVNGLPAATITASGPTVFCAGGSVNLTAGGGLSYNWSSGAGTSIISVTNSGTFTVTATDGNGCKGTSAATIVTVNPLPTASITASGPTSFCAGGSVGLTASAGAAYVWSTGATTQSITVNTASSLTVRVTDINGCTNQSAAINVTVNALPTATVSASGPTSFCAGGSVSLTASAGAGYLWSTGATTQTISVTGSGTPSVRVTGANGCNATSAPVTVTVNPLPVATINNGNAVSFCAGSTADLTASAGSSYLWSTGATTRTISVGTAGARSVTVTDANGCSAVSAVTNVTVNPLPLATISAVGPTTFCAGGSVSLTASAGAGYLWSTGATSRSISMNTSGNPTVTVTDLNGCSATSTPTAITVNPLPNLIITHPAAVCAPGTVNLTAAAVTAGSTAGTVFTYFTDAATSIPFTTPTTTGVAGTYYIKGTLPTGCSSSRAVTVVVNNPPSLTTQNPTAVCAPQTVDLSSPAITQGSDNGLVYTYFTNAALSTPLLNPTAVGNSGVYYIKANAPGSACSAALPVTVTVHPIPTGNLQTPAVNYVCSGSTLPLTATDAFAYQWLLNQTPIAGATNAVYQASTAGVYSVRFISQEGCVREATNTLRIDQLVKPVLRLQWNSRCVAVPVSFSNLSTYASSGGINWLWDFGDGALANTFSPTHTYATAGNYTVSLTANNLSCPTLTETISIPVYVDSARVPVRYPTVKAVAGKAFPLTARSLGALYRWQPATGLNSTTVQSPMAILNNDIEYTVTITNSASCTTTDTVAVKLVFDGNIFVGNGFTPNGDGVNDRCYPILTGVRSLVYFKIYNRWGNLVFQTNDASPQNGWDGKYNGRLQPVGTYTWIAEAIDGNGNMFKRNGNVLLIN